MTAGAELLGSAVLELTVDPSQMRRGMTAAEREAVAGTDRMNANVAKRMDAAGKKMSQTGSAMTRGITVPLLGAAATAVNLGSDFSAAMERIHTQSGEAQSRIHSLSQEVLDLAKHSTSSPIQLADALYRIEGAGLRGAAAMKAVRSAADLAAVGNANVEDTAKTMAQVMFTGIKGLGGVRSLAAQLNATVGAGDLRLQQLVDALGTGVVASAKQAGLSFKDVTGALAVFGDETNNVSGWAAQLATAFHFLTNPGSKASGALKDIGLSQAKLVADLAKPQGLYRALGDIKTRLEGLPGGIRGPKSQQILGDILPGGRGRVLLVLMNQLDRYRQKMEQTHRTQAQFGDSIKKAYEQPQAQMKVAWDKIQADAIQVGQVIGPPLVKIGREVADSVDRVVTAFSKLPPSAQHAILTGGLITAGVGPALKVLGLFTGGVGKLYDAALIADKLATGKGFDLGRTKGLVGGGPTAVTTMEVGTLIAKSMVGGPGGAVSTAEKTAVGDAAAADASRGAGILSRGRLAGLAGMGIGGFAGMASADNNPGSKLLGFVHGADPTSVLHLAGLPALSDLLPAANQERASLQRVLSGHADTTGWARTQLSGVAVPHKQLSQFTLDVERAQAAISNMANVGVKGTIKTFGLLSQTAKALGDVKYQFADRLGAELLKTRNVGAKGVRGLIAEVDKLPPAARADASAAMIGMARQLESKGKLPRNATNQLRDEIAGTYANLTQRVIRSQGQMTAGIQANSGQARRTAAENFGALADNVAAAMHQGVLKTSQGSTLIAKALNATLKAFGAKPIPVSIGIAAGAIKGNMPTGGQNLFERGGLVQFGRPGQAGQDAIPVRMGGQDIMVGAGEVGAVFNRHQLPVLNARLSDLGGLPGLFSKVNRPHYMASGGMVGNVPAMISEANRVNSKHFPYVWGGGHSGFTGGPFDCSGAVSDILHAGGVLNAPRVSGDFMSYGAPGPGAVTLYANPEHVYMSLLGRFFGTSGANAGGGAGWFAGAARPGFAVRHIGGGGHGGAGGFGQISAPKVTGTGTIPTLARHALRKMAGAANVKASSVASTMMGGGFGGGQHSENLHNQALGKQMMVAAGWPLSQWPALQALWSQESGWDANAVNKGSGAYGIPQALGHGRPFALGDARAQIAWGLNYIRGRYGSPNAAEAHERAFNWYARGGLIPGFAAGGTAAHPSGPVRDSKTGKPIPKSMLGPKHRKAKPHPLMGGLRKPIRQVPGGGADIQNINSQLKMLDWIAGPNSVNRLGVTNLSELLGYWPQEWSIENPLAASIMTSPSSAVISTDPVTGLPVAPYVDQPDVNQAVAWLEQQMGWQGQTIADYQRVVATSGPLGTMIQAAVKRRQDAIARIKKQIEANLKKIAELSREAKETDPSILKLKEAINTAGAGSGSVTSLRSQIAQAEAIKVPSGKRGDAQRQAKKDLVAGLRVKLVAAEHGHKVNVADLRNELLAVEDADHRHKAGLHGQITSLEDVNRTLGGSPSSVGTGGRIKPLTQEISGLGTSLGSVANPSGSYSSNAIQGVSGVGGLLGTANLTYGTLKSELAALDPAAVAQALAQAASSGASPAGSTGIDQSALIALLEQQNLTLKQQANVFNSQKGVFADAISQLPPFGGSFAAGGVVPGPVGVARTIIAHGGENISPAGADAEPPVVENHMHFHGKARELQDLIDMRVQHTTRGMARGAAVPRPSRGYAGRLG